MYDTHKSDHPSNKHIILSMLSNDNIYGTLSKHLTSSTCPRKLEMRDSPVASYDLWKGGREGGSEGGGEGVREGGREGGKERGREGEREGGREGGRERGGEGGREEGNRDGISECTCFILTGK